MKVHILSILKIYDGERFIAGTHGRIRSFISLWFDDESFIRSENPSFLRRTRDDSEKVVCI